MMKKQIAVIVEDEEDISNLVSLYLEKAGFSCYKFSNAGDFLSFVNTRVPDLVILDLMLPDADGMDVCRKLRSEEKFNTTAIIILTAKSEEVDRVLGLEMGADDYVVKPFSPRELVARVKAVQRRIQKSGSEDTIRIGDSLLINKNRMEVFVRGEKIDLTPTEFRLLLILAEKKGWIFSRDRLLEKLWGNEKDTYRRTIDVHIANLRKKLKGAGKLIKSVKGMGYKLEV